MMIDDLAKEIAAWSDKSYRDYEEKAISKKYILEKSKLSKCSTMKSRLEQAAESYGAWLAFQNVLILIDTMKMKERLEVNNVRNR